MTEVVRVRCEGLKARFIYSDAAVGLIARADVAETTRVSHVEPAETIGWGAGWIADMRPVKGPILHDGFETFGLQQKRPFATRQAALDAERVWLRERFGV